MTWKNGVSTTFCALGQGGHNTEIYHSFNKLANDISYSLSRAIINKRAVKRDTLGIHILPPKFNKYTAGGEYESHVDAAWIGGIRTDYACTLFVSDRKDYEGGELWVGDKMTKAEQGHAVIYECGAPHHVTPVTKGERVCAVTWIHSMVQDPYKRKLLIKFQHFIHKHRDDPDVRTQAAEIFGSLQKMWMTR